MSQSKPHEQMLKWRQEKPNQVFLRQIKQGQFHDFTFSDVVDTALRLVSALKAQGFQEGDKIGLISKNCAEWFITDLALMLGNFISVPVFPTAGTDTISHVLSHSETKALFIGKLDDTKALKQSLIDYPTLATISFPYPTLDCDFNWHDFIADTPLAEIAAYRDDNQLMSIVYTSGTSGLAKGAMLSYGAFAWTCQQLSEHIKIKEDDKLFSYLPLAHITERVYIMGSAMNSGLCTAFPESLDTFIDNVKMHQPTLFISVPRLWTLFQQRIQQKLPESRLNLLLKVPFISSFIKKKIIRNLGLDKARVLGCGSAPVPAALLTWYKKIGLDITEAWGMTESFAYATLNYPFRADKIGTVGRAASGVEIKISDKKEILMRSHGLFLGYYKDQKATDETFKDGWLHTGDLGVIDSEGFVTIEGRKHDTFKTAKGKFVSPVPIEKRLFELSNIEMLCLVGSGMPSPILLALPHFYPQFDRKRYERKIKRVLETINQELESHEKIKGALMIKEAWSIENGFLTPTLKIKRHLLEKKYHDQGLNWPKDRFIMWED